MYWYCRTSYVPLHLQSYIHKILNLLANSEASLTPIVQRTLRSIVFCQHFERVRIKLYGRVEINPKCHLKKSDFYIMSAEKLDDIQIALF